MKFEKKAKKLAKKPKNWRNIAEIAWRDIRRGDPDRAKQRLESLSEEAAAQSEFARLRARVAWLRGFPEAAVSILEAALKDVPNDEACRLDLVVLYLHADRLTDAEALLAALGAHAKSAPALMAGYAVYMARGDAVAARRQLQTAVAALIVARGKRCHPDPVNAPLFPSRLLED